MINTFFNKFPKVSLRLSDTTILQYDDIFRFVDANDLSLQSYTNYQYYEIANGARPDVVSYDIYGTPEYAWTFFILNDRLKAGTQEWPMSDLALNNYIEEKYNNYGILSIFPQFLDPVNNDEMIQNWSIDTMTTDFEIDLGSNTNTFMPLSNFLAGIDITHPNLRVRRLNTTGDLGLNNDYSNLIPRGYARVEGLESARYQLLLADVSDSLFYVPADPVSIRNAWSNPYPLEDGRERTEYITEPLRPEALKFDRDIPRTLLNDVETACISFDGSLNGGVCSLKRAVPAILDLKSKIGVVDHSHTYSVWLKPTTDTGIQFLMSFGTTPASVTSPAPWMTIAIAPGLESAVFAGSNSTGDSSTIAYTGYINADPQLVVNEWNHIAFSFSLLADASQASLRFIFNGVVAPPMLIPTIYTPTTFTSDLTDIDLNLAKAPSTGPYAGMSAWKMAGRCSEFSVWSDEYGMGIVRAQDLAFSVLPLNPDNSDDLLALYTLYDFGWNNSVLELLSNQTSTAYIGNGTTIYPDSRWGTGRWGWSGLTLDNLIPYVQNATDQGTISFWVKSNITDETAVSGYEASEIAALHIRSASNPYGDRTNYAHLNISHGSISLSIYDDAPLQANLFSITAATPVRTDWIHVAFVKPLFNPAAVTLAERQANRPRVYINGRLHTIGIHDNERNWIGNIDNITRIFMNARSTIWIDELAIYNEALSAAEILAQWNEGEGVYTSAADARLVALYHCDDGHGSVSLEDDGPNGADGVLINSDHTAFDPVGLVIDPDAPDVTREIFYPTGAPSARYAAEQDAFERRVSNANAVQFVLINPYESEAGVMTDRYLAEEASNLQWRKDYALMLRRTFDFDLTPAGDAEYGQYEFEVFEDGVFRIDTLNVTDDYVIERFGNNLIFRVDHFFEKAAEAIHHYVATVPMIDRWTEEVTDVGEILPTGDLSVSGLGTPVPYFEEERNLNEARRKIIVMKPSMIKDFAKKYRQTLGTTPRLKV